MSDITVIGVPGSPYVRMPVALLEERGAPYRFEALAPGSAGGSDAYQKLNPFGRIPTIRDGEFVLYETQAILRYLDRILPGASLTPADPRRAARMDQVMNIADWYLFQGVGNVIGFHRIVAPRLLGRDPDLAAIEAALPAARRVLGVLDGILGDQAWFAGDAFSLADIAIAAHVDFLVQTPEWAPLAEPCAHLSAWWKRVSARPSIAATTWDEMIKIAARG